MNSPTKTAANEILGDLIEGALEMNPDDLRPCAQTALLDGSWLNAVDFAVDQLTADTLLSSGTVPASPETPAKSAKRIRTKTPDQLAQQAVKQKGRRKAIAESLDNAVGEVASLQSLLTDCQKSLEHSRAVAVEKARLLATVKQLKAWPKKNVALGMHETFVCCHDSEFEAKHFEELSYCVNHVLANEGEGFFVRDEFAPTRDGDNLRGENRFVWRCADHSRYHTDPRCSQYWAAIEYIQSQFPGHELRDNKYSASVQTGDQYILDSGDYTKPFSTCTSELESHMDNDGGRGTSLSVCIPMDDDAIKIVKNCSGEQFIMPIKKGQIAIWNSAVYHLGAGHKDFNGRDLSKFRRRLFLYFDDNRYQKANGEVIHPKDKDGAQLHADHVPIPDDYNCNIWENIPSLSVAYNALSSRHLEGRIIVTERTLNAVITNAGELNTLPA